MVFPKICQSRMEKWNWTNMDAGTNWKSRIQITTTLLVVTRGMATFITNTKILRLPYMRVAVCEL